MSDIYLKPLVDSKGVEFFAVMESGIRRPTFILTRDELRNFINQAESFLEVSAKMSKLISNESGADE